MRESPILFMAPLAGVTNRVFRQLVIEQGADYVCTEMISVQGLIQGNPKTHSLLDLKTGEPSGIQLFGREPEDFVRAAAIIVEQYRPLFIDINMGCPVPKVVKGGMGAALMREPARVEALVRALVENISVPVSVKIRLGWSPEELTGPEVARRCEEGGASWITVHGRTRDQFYRGQADWEGIGAIARERKVPVVANGDIFSARDAEQMMSITGCPRIMVGRGALGNPWIFKRIKERFRGEKEGSVSLREILSIMKKHMEGQVELRGSEKKAILEMRRHFSWYIKGWPGARDFRQRLMGVKSKAEVYRELERFFQQVEEERR